MTATAIENTTPSATSEDTPAETPPVAAAAPVDDIAAVKPDQKAKAKTSAAKTAAAKKTGDAPAAPARAAGKRGPAPALKDTDDKKMVAAVETVVPDGKPFHTEAIRYGRKVAKHVRGLRGTAPASLGGLKKDTAAKINTAVREALGA